MSKLVKGISNLAQNTDPLAYGLSKVQQNNSNNALVNTLLPGASQTNRLNQGEGLTPRLAGDPGTLFTQTKAKTDADIAKAKVEAAAKVMPLANGQDVELARRRAAALQQQRGGRASTILTGTTDSLGG